MPMTTSSSEMGGNLGNQTGGFTSRNRLPLEDIMETCLKEVTESNGGSQGANLNNS